MRAFASIAFLAAASVVGLNGCSPAAETADLGGARPERQCFDADRVTNFRADQTHTLYIEAANRDVYELSTSGACNDLGSTFGIALTPVGSGFGRLCTGDSANLRIQSSTAPVSPCRARVVRLLTPEQVEALPSRLRP